jgi:predicted small metal-binding protein
MAKRITCDCGYVVLGENDDELLANAREHIRTAHAEQLSKISDDDLLAQAEEV